MTGDTWSRISKMRRPEAIAREKSMVSHPSIRTGMVSMTR